MKNVEKEEEDKGDNRLLKYLINRKK